MDIDNVIELRQRIGDPEGFPMLVDSEVPDFPDELTAYRIDTSKYVDCNGERIPIIISDTRLNNWITEYGIDKAEYVALKNMIATLSGYVQIESSTTGAESTKFASLTSRLAHLKYLLSLVEDRNNMLDGSNTGLVGRTKQPIIAGGDL
jgi:hypothetical protein